MKLFYIATLLDSCQLIETKWRIYASVNWVIIGWGKDMSPVQYQAITRTNADLLLITPLGVPLSEIHIKTQEFSFMKMHFNISSAKWQPFCPGEMS